MYLPEPPFPHAEVSLKEPKPRLLTQSTIPLTTHFALVVVVAAAAAQLIQTNKLKHYPSIHGDFSSDFRQPCVVFTGHPSLRFGDVVHFMELWGKSSLNTIIFTGASTGGGVTSLPSRPSCPSRAL